MRRILSRSAVALLSLCLALGQGTLSLAGTTGEITGTVADASTHKPLAAASVTVISPSQRSTTSTDAQGRFSFLSLAPDTYAITVSASGHATTTLSGITVQADQIQTLALSATPRLQTIGSVTTRAASSLIRAGQTTDVYSVDAATAALAAPLGGGGSLNQAYSAIASVPGVYLPSGQVGWAQSVYVRGGNYTQLGYDYDGIPVQRAYDAYPSSTLSALGQQEVQVYAGSAPGSAQSNGLAGFVNQIIKTGTYPAVASAQIGVGTPTFYNKGQFEFGGATPSRSFSYYLGYADYQQSNRYVDQFDGAAAQYNYGTFQYAAIRQNCGQPNATAGCYANGFGSAPNGYLYLPINYGNGQNVGDREFVANLHAAIPHRNDGLRDDVQFLSTVSLLGEHYNDSYNSFGSAATQFFKTGIANYNGVTYPSCPSTSSVGCVINLLGIGSGFSYGDRSIYTGPVGTALTAANVGQVSQYVFPFEPSGNGLGGPVDPSISGGERINDAIFKLQYTHAMGTNAYARLYGYSLYSSWLNTNPNATSNPFAIVPPDYTLPTHTRGVGLTVADQLGSHLFNLTAGLSTATLSRWNNGFPSPGNPAAVLVNSANPAGGCYAAPAAPGMAAPAPCVGGADAYAIPHTNTPASNGLTPTGNATLANLASYTCGTGPCEFLTVGSGLNGSFNNVTPTFGNFSLTDSWNATPKLSLDLGVRYDSFHYQVPSATVAQGPNPQAQSAVARELFTNSYDQYHCYSPSTGIVGAVSAGVCPTGTSLVAFSNANPTSLWFGGFQPRVGATFKVDPLNVLRADYGRYLQPSSTAYTFYNRAGADVAGYDAPKFYPFGFSNPTHAIPPEESFNLDFSWEHQVRGTDISWKVTPFYRTTRNEDVNVILDPVTNFSSAIPALASHIEGVELFLRKGDFNRNGFAAQLAYTYTYETSKYQTLPGGTTALTDVNNSVSTYNAYTSFCSTHPTDKRCGTTTNGSAAAPCYTAGGSPDPSCAAGDFANPYWNAPVQQLFDPTANYYPYNQTFGTGFSSNASSYNIPHVAALIVNYKHDKWAFTPTIQVSGGGRYGSPVQGIGIDPNGGCGTLAAANLAGDPRYPYGAPGGAPYDAQTCPGFITAPNPYTQKFDTPGQFVEPTQLLANLGISYAASKRLTLNMTAVNVFGTCFGGSKEPWTFANSKLGCWYGSAIGLQSGNFYNPGNAFQTQSYPYFPTIGEIAGQQVYGTNVNPLQVFITANFKL